MTIHLPWRIAQHGEPHYLFERVTILDAEDEIVCIIPNNRPIDEAMRDAILFVDAPSLMLKQLGGEKPRFRRALEQYAGYTYSPLLDNALCHWLWRRVFCRRGWHLWDEVLSGLGEAHYLYCDACEESVHIREPQP